MTEPAKPSEKIWPPNDIVADSFTIDGVLFVMRQPGRLEAAIRGEARIGEVLKDIKQDKEQDAPAVRWMARKPDVTGEWCDWKEMRCVHEARAFIVSKRAGWFQ